VLSAAETRAAESLLAASWGASVTVRAAEKIWDRHHVVRLHTANHGDHGDHGNDGRSVVLKRRREENFGDQAQGFDAELAALEFLNTMETAIAPKRTCSATPGRWGRCMPGACAGPVSTRRSGRATLAPPDPRWIRSG
jgi:hypothetical protein